MATRRRAAFFGRGGFHFVILRQADELLATRRRSSATRWAVILSRPVSLRCWYVSINAFSATAGEVVELAVVGIRAGSHAGAVDEDELRHVSSHCSGMAGAA